MPPALAYLYTDATAVVEVLSKSGVKLRLDDDQDGAVTAAEYARLTNAINRGTSRCNLYLNSRYDPQKLADEWCVQDWATTIAACELCRARGNPIPRSLLDDQADAILEMTMVMNGELQLSVGELATSLPAYSNGTLDNRYTVRQWRIERGLSSRTPGQVRQDVAWADQVIAPFEQYP